jgi:hypothetical protein
MKWWLSLSTEHLALMLSEFDHSYYLATYPDIREGGLNPFHHFMENGWQENRNPNAAFDTAFYLDLHPDIAASGVNPFLHYLVHGRGESRPGRQNMFDEALQNIRPVEESIKAWRAGVKAPELDSANDLRAAINRAATDNLGLVISFSHDDHHVTVGGVQGILRDEEAGFLAAGFSYLHISPVYALPMAADAVAAEEYLSVVNLDGKKLGAFRFSDITNALKSAKPRMPLQFIVHHLYGQVPELIAEMGRTLKVRDPIVWVHDFSTLCAQYSLLRNNVKFCHAPPVDSTACSICVYGSVRRTYLDRVRAMFQALNPIVLSPSAFALDFWRLHGDLPHRARAVVPPARLTLSNVSPAKRTGKLRVAHLGHRLYHKGWPVFSELAQRADPERYEFYRIGGTENSHDPGIHHVGAMVTAENPAAMVEAIGARGIDVVVNWSQCGETFNFTTLEALAGGAFVVARHGAGNVWPAIQSMAPGQGMAVDSEEDLLALFQGDELARRVAASNRRYGAVTRLDGTAGWLLRRMQGESADRAA